MSVAKDEIGAYSIATRFGNRERIYHDKKWTRPANISEMLRQIEATRLGNKWRWSEFADNCAALGLPVPMDEAFKADDLRGYSSAQLQTILDDFERYRMILYEV